MRSVAAVSVLAAGIVSPSVAEDPGRFPSGDGDHALTSMPLFFFPGEDGVMVSRSLGSEMIFRPGGEMLLRTPDAGRVSFHPENGNISSRPEGLQAGRGRVHVYRGSDPNRWQEGLPSYSRVRYREVYPGVDLVFYGSQRDVEFDYIVGPGGDPAQIAMRFRGARELRAEANGDLTIVTEAGGVLTHRAPVVYQEEAGNRTAVAGAFVFRGKDLVGFELGDYDPRRPLVIDPILEYATLLGGSASDVPRGLRRDGDGNLIIAGETASTNFPVTPGAYGTNGGPNVDVYLTKLDAAGTSLVFSTYIGSSLNDTVAEVALDPSGGIYIGGGAANNDFPVTPGAFRTVWTNVECFVARFTTNGTLVYSTYIGGFNNEYASGLDVDRNSNAYLVGYTYSTSQFTIVNGHQTVNRGDADGFLARLTSSGSNLAYSTYIGGNGFDNIWDVVVDSLGRAYISGQTYSTNFPLAIAPSPGNVKQGVVDATVSRINTAGSGAASLMYSRYLGGTGFEQGRSIAIDARSNAWVTGLTDSSNFPLIVGAVQTGFLQGVFGATDAFVTRIGTNALTLYSSYLGGYDYDVGGAIVVDAATNVYVGGQALSTNFPLMNSLYALSDNHGFVTQINPALSGTNALVFSTAIGGNGSEVADLVVSNDRIYGILPAGGTLPTSSGAFQTNAAGGGDTYVFVLGAGPDLAVTKTASVEPATNEFQFAYVIVVSNRGPGGATSVVLSDPLPSNVVYVSSSPGQGVCSQLAGTVTCNLGAIPSGSVAVVTISVAAVSAAVVTNVATAAATGDTVASNNAGAVQTTIVVLDEDGDEIADWWELQYFGGATNATAGADEDGDGYSNLDEYIALTHPSLGGSYPALVQITAPPSFSFNSSILRMYQVESSDDLFAGVWTPLDPFVFGEGGVMTLSDPSGGTSAYYRLKTRKP